MVEIDVSVGTGATGSPGRSVWRVGEEVVGLTEWPSLPAELEGWVQRWRGGGVADPELTKFVTRCVVPSTWGDGRAIEEEVRKARVGRGGEVILRVSCEDDAGWSLPFELATWGNEFLLAGSVSLERVPEAAGVPATVERRPGKMSVLVVVADTAGAENLSLVPLLKKVVEGSKVKLEFADPQSLSDLEVWLADRGEVFDSVLVFGHGGPNGVSFPGPHGTEVVGPQQLADLFVPWSTTVFLAACEAGGEFGAPAAVIASRGVPVLALQTIVPSRVLVESVGVWLTGLRKGMRARDAASAVRVRVAAHEAPGTNANVGRVAWWNPRGELRLRPPDTLSRPHYAIRTSDGIAIEQLRPRDAVIGLIAAALDDPDVALIDLRGPAGYGKSSLMRLLDDRLDERVAVSLLSDPVSTRHDLTLSPIIDGLAGHLSFLTGRATPSSLHDGEPLDQVARLGEFFDGTDWSGPRPIVLLDEIERIAPLPGSGLLDLQTLGSLLEQLGPRAVFIVAGRPTPRGLLDNVTRVRQIDLTAPELLAEATNDIADHTRWLLDRLPDGRRLAARDTDEAIGLIATFASGMFLVPRVIVTLIETGRIAPTIDELRLALNPTGGTFDNTDPKQSNPVVLLYQNAFDPTNIRDLPRWERLCRILDTLALCGDQSGFTLQQLAAICDQFAGDLVADPLVAPWVHYGPDHRRALFHASFCEWWKRRSPSFSSTTVQLATRLVEIFNNGSHTDLALTGYLAKHLPSHIAQAIYEAPSADRINLTSTLRTLLHDPDYLADTCEHAGTNTWLTATRTLEQLSHRIDTPELNDIDRRQTDIATLATIEAAAQLSELGGFIAACEEWGDHNLTTQAVKRHQPRWTRSCFPTPTPTPRGIRRLPIPGQVDKIAYSPDGTLTAITSVAGVAGGAIWVVDPTGGTQPVVTLPGRVDFIALSADGRLAVASGTELWVRHADGSLRLRSSHNEPLDGLTWSATGHLLVLVGGKVIAYAAEGSHDDLQASHQLERINWRAESSARAVRAGPVRIEEISGERDAAGFPERWIARSADDELAEGTWHDGVWWGPWSERASGTYGHNNANDWIDHIAWSASGCIAMATEDEVLVIDRHGSQIQLSEVPVPVDTLHWSSLDQLVVAAADGAWVWTLTGGTMRLPVRGRFRKAEWSDDGQLALAGPEGVWVSTASGKSIELGAPFFASSFVGAIAWSSQGSLAIGGIEGAWEWTSATKAFDPIDEVRVECFGPWNDELLPILGDQRVLLIDRSGTVVAEGRVDGLIDQALWWPNGDLMLVTRGGLCSLSPSGGLTSRWSNEVPIYRVAVSSANGHRLAMSSREGVAMHDEHSEMRFVDGIDGVAHGMEWSNDGRKLAVVTEDTCWVIDDLGAPNKVTDIKGDLRTLTWGPADQLAVVTSDGVWLREMNSAVSYTAGVTDVDWAPDGRLAVATTSGAFVVAANGLVDDTPGVLGFALRARWQADGNLVVHTTDGLADIVDGHVHWLMRMPLRCEIGSRSIASYVDGRLVLINHR